MENNTNDYSRLSDEELVAIAKTDRDAEDYLLNKYKNLVVSRAKLYFLAGGDSDDLIQEGMIGLFKAIHDYSPEKNAGFATFAELCIRRRIYSAIKQSQRQKNMPLNSYISLDDPLDDELPMTYSNIVGGESALDPEALYLKNENLKNIEQEIDEKLTELEKRVLILHMQGMSYAEIGAIINKSAKSIDNALQRIKRKFG